MIETTALGSGEYVCIYYSDSIVTSERYIKSVSLGFFSAVTLGWKRGAVWSTSSENSHHSGQTTRRKSESGEKNNNLKRHHYLAICLSELKLFPMHVLMFITVRALSCLGIIVETRVPYAGNSPVHTHTPIILFLTNMCPFRRSRALLSAALCWRSRLC